jgi:cystathionine gamma-synthase
MSQPNLKSTTSTDAVHAGIQRARSHHTLTPSIAQTATYTFENTATLERYMRGEDPDPEREEYGRYGNPTVRELERRVAALEGAEDAVAFPSGMAATSSTLLALLKAGDHVVLFRDCYRRTRQLVTQTLLRFGVEHTVVDAGDLSAMEAALRPNTRMVITESPTNPLNYCVDLERLSAITKAKGRVRTLVDSTFATPVNSQPLGLGIDLVLHSATKYLSGHNDVLGGVVAGPSHLISLLRDTRGVLGTIMDPHAAFLIMRGLKTLALRVERQNQSALTLAKALERHPKVEHVYYPWLESHPSYPIAAAQMRGGGAVVSFVVRGGRAAASRVVDAVRIPQIAASLGGVESLIEQPAIMSFFELGDDDLQKIGINPALIRLSVGIEEACDLTSDLLSALDRA